MDEGEVFDDGLRELGSLNEVALVECLGENTSIPLLKGVVSRTLLQVFEGLG